MLSIATSPLCYECVVSTSAITHISQYLFVLCYFKADGRTFNSYFWVYFVIVAVGGGGLLLLGYFLSLHLRCFMHLPYLMYLCFHIYLISPSSCFCIVSNVYLSVLLQKIVWF